MQEKAMTVKYGSYKGHPTIILDADSKYPFEFGIAKALKILACLPEIRIFVDSHNSTQLETSSAVNP